MPTKDKGHAKKDDQKQSTARVELPGPSAILQAAHSAAALQRAMANPRRLAPSEALALQHSLGNRATRRLLPQKISRSSQAPLPTKSNDKAADPLAIDKVAGGQPLFLQRRWAPPDTIAERVQMKHFIRRTGPEVEGQLARQKGGGEQLPGEVRRFMEPRFGQDFSQVRVHVNPAADQLNRSLNARAFTTGPHIFFKRGQYDPASTMGRELIAHELTHVAQQGASVAQRASVKAQPGVQPGTRPLGQGLSPATPGVVQRAVGFEMEADQFKAWQLKRPLTDDEKKPDGRILKTSVTAEQRRPMHKGQRIYVDPADGFELQADEIGNGADIEFVTKAFEEADLKSLIEALDEIGRIDTGLEGATKDSVGARSYIWPAKDMKLGALDEGSVILLENSQLPIFYKMQSTAGIRLEQIANLMESIGTPANKDAEAPEVSEKRAPGRDILQSQYAVGKIMGAAPGQAALGVTRFLAKYAEHAASRADLLTLGVKTIEREPASLKSLLALINMYITSAGTMSKLSYPKAMAGLLGRTKFSSLFKMMPMAQRDLFIAGGGVYWRELIRATLDAKFQDLDQPLFKVSKFGDRDRFRDLTRGAWIKAIPDGKDLLTANDYKGWQDTKLAELKAARWFPAWCYCSKQADRDAIARKNDAEYLESLGSYGDKTENVGPADSPVAAGIFELRGMWAGRTDLKAKQKEVDKKGSPLTALEDAKLGAQAQGKVTASEAKDIAQKLLDYIGALNRKDPEAAYGREKK